MPKQKNKLFLFSFKALSLKNIWKNLGIRFVFCSLLSSGYFSVWSERIPIIPEANASEGKKATLDIAPNGVTVVNIAKPNREGLSHNLFQDFHVSRRGVVMNNSRGIGRSQLAGTILGNPKLNGGAARIILAEVVGGSPSRLEGYTEIFGQQAEYILANPYGISCNGCGFINTPRVTLSTARPQWEGDHLRGLSVERGEIGFYGSGVNAKNVEYFDIITQRVIAQAEIRAKKLSFFLGRNNFDYMTRRITSQQAAGIDSHSTAWALDASSMGSMYADHIYLEATENGIGVRMANHMAANTGDLKITAAGNILLKKQISSVGDITFRTKQKILIEDKLYGGRNIKIYADEIEIKETGSLFSRERLFVNGERFSVKQGGQIAAGVGSDGRLYGRLLWEQNIEKKENGILEITLGARLMNSGLIAANQSMKLQVRGDITNESIFFSGGTMEVYSSTFTNGEGAELLSFGSITLARNARLEQSTQVSNQSGRIESQKGNVTIYSDSIENIRKNFAVRVDRFTGGSISLPGFRCEEDDCFGNPWNGRVRRLKEQAVLNGALTTVAAQIFAGDSVRLFANLIQNEYSQIYAKNDISIESAVIENRAGQMYESYENRNWHVDFNHSVGDVCKRKVLGVCQSKHQYYAPAWVSASYLEEESIGNDIDAIMHAGRDINIAGNFQNYGGATRQANTTTDLSPSSTIDVHLFKEAKGLFITSANVDHPYLIETNPLFANLDRYIGSDYFFDKTGITLEKLRYNQRLGDPFYETRLVQKQIFEKIGMKFTQEKIINSAEQMKFLFDNAAQAKDALQLTVGISLDAKQIQNLKRDIIWLEERMVRGKRVLVPQLYLSKLTRQKAYIHKASIQARNINIKGASFINEGGNLFAKDKIDIRTSGDIRNILGKLEGNKLILYSKKNIRNQSGTIQGKEVHVTAIENVVNEVLKKRLSNDSHNYSDFHLGKSIIQSIDNDTGEKKESLEQIGLLKISAGGDIRNIGSQLYAKGNAHIAAGGNIQLDSLVLENKFRRLVSDRFAKFSFIKSNPEKSDYEKSFKRNHLASLLEVGGDLSLASRKNFSMIGAQLSVEGSGDIDIMGNISIRNVHDIDFYEKKVTHKERTSRIGKSSSQTTTQVQGHKRKKTISSSLSFGKDVSITSQNKIKLIASKLYTRARLSLNADDIVTSHGKNSIEERNTSITRRSGYSISSKGANGHSSLEKQKQNSSRTEIVLSQIVGGSIDINSRKNIHLEGLGLLSQNDLTIHAGGDFTLGAVKKIQSSFESNYKEEIDIDLKQDADLTLSYGVSQSESQTSQETAVSSLLQSNSGNIYIEAGNGLFVKGSNIVAKEGDIELHGKNTIEILSAKEYASQGTNSSQMKGSLSTNVVKLASGVVNFEVSLSDGQSDSSSASTNHLQSLLGAKKGRLYMHSNGDMKIKGAIVKGKDVAIKVLKNLDLESVQNTSAFQSNSQSRRMSLSYGPGDMGFSASYNQSKATGNRAWVDSVTSIVGTSSVDMNIGENMKIKGASIANQKIIQEIQHDAGNLNILVGGKLSVESIMDYDISKSSSHGAGVGYNTGGDFLDAIENNSLQFTKKNKNKRGITRATIGMGKIKVGKGRIAKELNRNIQEQQEITKDEKSDRGLSLDAGDYARLIKNYRKGKDGVETLLDNIDTFSIGETMEVVRSSRQIIGAGSGVASSSGRVVQDVTKRIGEEKLGRKWSEELSQIAEYTNTQADFLYELDIKNRVLYKIKTELGIFKNLDIIKKQLDNLDKKMVQVGIDTSQRMKNSVLGDHNGKHWNWENDTELISRIASDIEKGLNILEGDFEYNSFENSVKDAMGKLEFLGGIGYNDQKKDDILHSLLYGMKGSIVSNIKKSFHRDSSEFTEKKVGLLDYIGVDSGEVAEWLWNTRDQIAQKKIQKAYQERQIQEKKQDGLVLSLLHSVGSNIKNFTESIKNIRDVGHYKNDLSLSTALFQKKDSGEALTSKEVSFIGRRFRKIKKATDAKKYQQNRKNTKLLNKLENIIKDADELEFDSGMKAERKNLQNYLQNKIQLKEKQRITARLREIDKKEEAFLRVKKALVKGREDKKVIAQKILAKLCNVISYNRIQVVTGKSNRSLEKFYVEELQKGNIGHSGKRVDFVSGSGSNVWREEAAMRRLALPKKKGIDATNFFEKELNSSGRQTAIVYQDTDNKPGPNHFFLIARNEKGDWMNLDHSSVNKKTRGEKVKWDKVHRIDYMK